MADRRVKRINPLDFQPDVAVGVGLPFGPTGRFNLNYETKEQIKDNLRNLILTMKGERVMQPRFGTDIYRLVFNPNTPELAAQIRSTIKDAVKEFMPFINLQDVVVTQEDTTLRVQINYSIPDFSIEDILTLSIDNG